MKIRWIYLIVLTMSLSACSEPAATTRAVYMLLDTSGTYTAQLDKAQKIIRFLLGNLNSGDSLALARIDSASFSEKDIVAKVTFDFRPTKATAEKRAFLDTVDRFTNGVKGSPYTDISGGVLQAIEYLNETGAGRKYILIFSDLKEEIKEGYVRDFPITFDGVNVIALNVTKLNSDNVDPREYMKRVDDWSRRVEEGNGHWRLMNDLDRIGSLLD